MNIARTLAEAEAESLVTARIATKKLSEILRRERAALAEFVVELIHFDDERLWAALGHASLFDFLHRELRLSRSATYYRVAAVGLVRRFPSIVAALAEGKLCVTALAEIAKVVTPQNIDELLPRFFYLSSREAKEVAAAIAPHPAPPARDVVTVVRAASVASAALELMPGTSCPGAWTADSGQPAVDREPTATLVRLDRLDRADAEPAGARHVPSPLERVEPLTAERRRLHITVSKRWLQKLAQVKSALSHSHPGASAEEVIEAAFDVLLEREAKKKGLVKSPRAPKALAPVTAQASAEERTEPEKKRLRKAIPAHVRRAVMLRDQGRCQAHLHDGSICGSTTRIQFDHVHPDALGGPPTIDNVRLLCASHNREAARRVFGDEWIDLFAR